MDSSALQIKVEDVVTIGCPRATVPIAVYPSPYFQIVYVQQITWSAVLARAPDITFIGTSNVAAS